MKDKTTNLKLKLEAPRFLKYESPKGYLTNHPACHALWYYYVIARNAFETNEEEPIVLEGDEDPVNDYTQIFTSVATLYGVQPEEMVKYWDNIDNQCRLLRLPLMGKSEKLRMNSVPEVRTQ